MVLEHSLLVSQISIYFCLIKMVAYVCEEGCIGLRVKLEQV